VKKLSLFESTQKRKENLYFIIRSIKQIKSKKKSLNKILIKVANCQHLMVMQRILQDGGKSSLPTQK
jgi:hypothetical protein